MTRTLILLRHAKSDWHSGTSDDHERPLNARGERAAVLVATHLRQAGLEPDLVVTSSAVRAVQTCELVLQHAGFTAVPIREPKLYLAKPNQILAVLRQQPADAHRILMVGHNPGFQELAFAVAEHGNSGLVDAIHEQFPTCAVAVCETVRAWSDAAIDTLSLTDFTYPKALV